MKLYWAIMVATSSAVVAVDSADRIWGVLSIGVGSGSGVGSSGSSSGGSSCGAGDGLPMAAPTYSSYAGGSGVVSCGGGSSNGCISPTGGGSSMCCSGISSCS